MALGAAAGCAVLVAAVLPAVATPATAAACTAAQLLGNPGFESGTSPWTASAG